MSLLLDQLPPNNLIIEGLEVTEMTSVNQLEQFARFVGEVYEFPDFSLHTWVDVHVSMGLHPQEGKFVYYCGWMNGQIVGAAGLFLRYEQGKIHPYGSSLLSVATLKAYQRM